LFAGGVLFEFTVMYGEEWSIITTALKWPYQTNDSVHEAGARLWRRGHDHDRLGEQYQLPDEVKVRHK
jgi:hypothetical protein